MFTRKNMDSQIMYAFLCIDHVHHVQPYITCPTALHVEITCPRVNIDSYMYMHYIHI